MIITDQLPIVAMLEVENGEGNAGSQQQTDQHQASSEQQAVPASSLRYSKQTSGLEMLNRLAAFACAPTPIAACQPWPLEEENSKATDDQFSISVSI